MFCSNGTVEKNGLQVTTILNIIHFCVKYDTLGNKQSNFRNFYGLLAHLGLTSRIFFLYFPCRFYCPLCKSSDL